MSSSFPEEPCYELLECHEFIKPVYAIIFVVSSSFQEGNGHNRGRNRGRSRRQNYRGINGLGILTKTAAFFFFCSSIVQ